MAIRTRTIFKLATTAAAAIALAVCASRGPARGAESATIAPVAGQDEITRIAVPFVAKHCVSCHNPEKHKADLVLSNYKDDKSILKDRKTWEHVLQMVEAEEMPPSNKPRPTSDELETFTNSIYGVFAKADGGWKDPGRVTLRRLNRVEYNNTIHDLLGIDFNAAEDLPADDVGHGFDNMGDVLTLSPLLLERYLSAAEIVTARAFPPGGNWASPLKVSANMFQPAAA